MALEKILNGKVITINKKIPAVYDLSLLFSIHLGVTCKLLFGC